jgi:hypothetical protein
MTRGRPAALGLLWCAALAASVLLLLELGRGPLPTPPVTDATRLREWLGAGDPVVTAFALLRVVALVVAGYLATVTVVGLVARAIRWPRLVRLADLGTVPAVRRLLGHVAGLGLRASTVTLVVGCASGGDGQAEVVAHQPAERPMVIERLDEDDGGTATMRVVPAEPATPRPASSSPAPSPPPRPVTWVAAPGESMWSKAESVLADAWRREPSDREVVGYWHALVDANRTRLADPDNADLIFVGQSFSVPPPPAAP